jgi:teichuronic acid biosynthesis glycosyltransferase TuaC
MMRLLVLTSTYPHPGHPFSGIFNERAAQALSKICDIVEVLAPRPYVPALLSSLVPRWGAYTLAAGRQIRNEIFVCRPAVPVVPLVGSAFWLDKGAFIWSRKAAIKMHRRTKFDAVLSFDLLGAGGLAWRIGRDLGLPAAGWATGGDVRVPASSLYAKVVKRALRNLDVVFYQSSELFEKAATLAGVSTAQLTREKHMVLPRGIPDPPVLPRVKVRRQLRKELGVADDELLILGVGRITREKGIYELIDAISLAAKQNSKIRCFVIGATPAFDETAAVEKHLDQKSHLKRTISILPTCEPTKVWEYLCAADIFVFTSHNEGMPNSLLEAMAMGVPSIAFAIPAVKELEGNTGGLLTVPPFDTNLFAHEILRLAGDPDRRAQIGSKGKSRVLDGFLVRKNMTIAIEKLSTARTAALVEMTRSC